MPPKAASTLRPASGRDVIPTLREPCYSQSLERGLAILTCFTPERPVLGIANIADELGMSRSTTHRYASTLAALGYLEQGPNRKYRLGLRVTDLGMSALNGTGLREHSQSVLEDLQREVRYAVNIAVLDGTDVVYVERKRSRLRGQKVIEIGLGPGTRLPAHVSAMGKLLLAHLPDTERGETVARMERLRRMSPFTILNKEALRKELVKIKEEGIATGNEELKWRLLEISAPIRDMEGEVVAAIGIEAPATMISLEEMVKQLGPHLISAAARISARLGYRRDDERNWAAA